MIVLHAKFNYYLLHSSRDGANGPYKRVMGANGPNWQYHHTPDVLANSLLKLICLLLKSKGPSKLRAKDLSPFIY